MIHCTHFLFHFIVVKSPLTGGTAGVGSMSCDDESQAHNHGLLHSLSQQGRHIVPHQKEGKILLSSQHKGINNEGSTLLLCEVAAQSLVPHGCHPTTDGCTPPTMGSYSLLTVSPKLWERVCVSLWEGGLEQGRPCLIPCCSSLSV